MENNQPEPVNVLIVAVPETAGSALYGMLDVLCATGSIWQTLLRSTDLHNYFRVGIVSPDGALFSCGNGIPVNPDHAASNDPDADIVVLPELWLGPDETLEGRYPELDQWIRRRYQNGAHIYSACSGALMLAATGLLDGCPATSHWGYQDVFRDRYPEIRFDPAPNLVYGDREGRIVTAGGTTSWHDLALHIIARHANPGEAMRIAKVYLLKWHDEGELPYASLARPLPHGDSVVRSCEEWLAKHFVDMTSLAEVVEFSGIAERTLKRRFKAANGVSLLEYIQNLRIERAKELLESGTEPVEEISEQVGYSDASFFRRLFKRKVGLPPARYRKMFAPIAAAGGAR